MSMPTLPNTMPLGGGDIGVAGADDLGDRRDRRGAVGQRRHRLRAADAIDLGDAGEMRRRQHQRIELAVRRRHHHDDARHAGDLGRHRVHQHRGRIGRGAARHVEPDRLDRGPAPAELDAERIGEAVVLRQLPAVKHLDAVAREFQRVERRRRRRPSRRRRSRPRVDAQAAALELEPVELARRLDQRRVAARRARRRRWRAPRASTSADTSRLAARKAVEPLVRNRRCVLSRRMGMAAFRQSRLCSMAPPMPSTARRAFDVHRHPGRSRQRPARRALSARTAESIARNAGTSPLRRRPCESAEVVAGRGRSARIPGIRRRAAARRRG